MASKAIQNIIDRASAGKISRDQALAQIKAWQDSAIAAIGIAEDAFDQDDHYANFEMIGADIGGPFAPALLVRDRKGREFELPVTVEKTAAGTKRVVFSPLVVAPQYIPVKQDTAIAAASKGTDRVRVQTEHAEAAAPQNPFWVTPDPNSYQKAIAKAAKPENRATRSQGPGGLLISTPTEKQKTAVKARAKANLDKASAQKRLDRWGDPI